MSTVSQPRNRSTNPYQVSSSLPGKADSGTKQAVADFDERHVFFASFLASPFAGAMLIARNYQRRGDSKSATTALLFGLTASVAFTSVSMMVGDRLPPVSGIWIALGYGMIMQQVAIKLFGKLEEKGNRKPNGNWKALGAAAASLMILIPGMIVVSAVMNL
ncbi:hypothetical protein [Neorhodopirellula pilleata]|uniref:Uncharacterized protein n=1 Tax=Neorhodopirellula pilleata TaxID=2714738 RepID=A0A5C6AI57_9BACT|nr:hypothetical protein [Neorhodopirellula pilleata]TWT98741.1 hypothetical protein Pla100_19060 [Neorhodopirellula pilleata]